MLKPCPKASSSSTVCAARCGASRKLARPSAAASFDDPAALLWQWLERPVKLAHTTLIVEADLALESGPLRVAYKQYRRQGLWKTFCRLFRRGPAQRAYRKATALAARHIATPRALAAFEPPRRRWFDPSYLATEWIAASENLHLYGWRLADVPCPERLLAAAAVAESLGRLVGRMHAAGVAHRDLKWANLLVVSGEWPQTFLVDVDGLVLGRRVSVRRQAADLARLAVGLTAHPWITAGICRRFFRADVGQFPPGQIAEEIAVAQRGRARPAPGAGKRRRGQEVL